LAGAAPLQMPASIDLVADAGLKDRFERRWGTASIQAAARYKLYKLVWGLIGSEFAGRHMLYEKFYAGNSIIVRNQSDREPPWEKFHGIVDGLLDAVAMPEVSGLEPTP
jgi:4-hydroxyphenylacetate 3-monooxygenase